MRARTIIPRHGSPRTNRGVIMMIALIALVAMTLGGIAIMRSVDTTTLIAGNLAFKQRALYATDAGIAEAMTWLVTNKASLANDSVANGYHSSQAFDWKDASKWTPGNGAKELTAGTDAAGNTVRFIIHRMCTCANTAYNGSCSSGGVTVANQCGIDNPSADASTTPTPREGDTGRADGWVAPSTGNVYYRVTVRAQGPRNTESFTQAMLTLSI